MIIRSVAVKNFRSIFNETINCDSLTALVGANGSGKSAFLRAIELFYTTTPRIVAEDFYNENTNERIEITVMFSNLNDDAKEKFARYIQDDTLTVVRVFTMKDGRMSDKYHGSTLRNPEFGPIRKATAAADLKTLYGELAAKGKYAKLGKYKNKNDVEPALAGWESENQSDCKFELDEGQFFGFKEVAQGYLGQYTRYLYIPAVRDAADDSIERGGSVISQLMDLVVRSVIENKEDVKEFRQSVQTKYGEIFDPTKLLEIKELSKVLSGTLRNYVPDSSVELDWLPFQMFSLPIPQASVRLVEDGYKCAVERTGHGLQRAFIMSLLRNLALAQAKNANPQAEKPKMPDLTLGIEEPELYQHPNRQRHLARILLQLAHGQIPGVADKAQVIYGTHSPLFVGLDRFDQIRIVRKVNHAADMPKKTSVTSRSLDQIAKEIGKLDKNEGYTGNALKPRLTALMDHWISEGFFASLVVLVEGDADRAVVLGAARAMNHDLESLGISVIPCNGKNNVFNAAVIFRSFGTPTYSIWDSDGHLGETAGSCATCGENLDAKGNPIENHRLLRLFGNKEEDWPGLISDEFACFQSNLERTLAEEIGKDDFERFLSSARDNLSIPKRKHAIKNAMVLAFVFGQAKAAKKSSKSLEAIIDKITAMHAKLQNDTEDQPEQEITWAAE